MEHWYVFSTVSGKEEKAAVLLQEKIDHQYWSECRILKKIKVFRTGGVLRLVEDVMFPGYVMIKTDAPGKLAIELKRAGDFPQPLGDREDRKHLAAEDMVPLEADDLKFLKAVCGENLDKTMGVTQISLNTENRIVRADGVLSRYLEQIVRLNLHKRFAVVEVELFNRKQPVVFSLRLEQDLAG